MRIVEVGAEAAVGSTGEARPPTPQQQRRHQQLRERELERQREQETHGDNGADRTEGEDAEGAVSSGPESGPAPPEDAVALAVGNRGILEFARYAEDGGGEWVSPRRSGRRARVSASNVQADTPRVITASLGDEAQCELETRDEEVEAATRALDEHFAPISDGAELTKVELGCETGRTMSSGSTLVEETKCEETHEALERQDGAGDKEEKHEAVLPVTVVGPQAEAKHEGDEPYGDDKREGDFVSDVLYRERRRASVETEEDIALLEYLSGAESDYSMDIMNRKGEDDEGSQALSPRSAGSDARDREAQTFPDSTGRSSHRYPALQTLQELPHEKYDSPRPVSQAESASPTCDSETKAPGQSASDTRPQVTTSLGSPMATMGLLEGDSDWVACETEKGESYYYNRHTLESQWTIPAAFDRTHHIDELCTLVATKRMSEPEMQLLEETIQSGMDLQMTNSEGLTPLHVASQAGNEQAVSLLVYYGAKVDAPALHEDSTALLRACHSGKANVVRLLMEANASLNASTSEGNTALHIAAHEGQDNILAALLGGCDHTLLSQKNAEGDTPLHVAVKQGHAGCVRSLLAYGADIGIEDFQGRTPLILSILENCVECVQLLQSAESTANTTNPIPLQAHNERQKPTAKPRDENEQDALSSLHSFLFQILPGGTSPESETVYQLTDEVEKQMSAMNASLQASKIRENHLRIQMEDVTAKLTTTSKELKKERALRADSQRHLAELELEQTTSRASHRALTSRCELLESIARNAQEKLGRERSEHSRYENILQKKLERSLRENAHVVQTLEGLQTSWASHQEQQREHQEHQVHRGSNDYYGMIQGQDYYETQQTYAGEGYYETGNEHMYHDDSRIPSGQAYSSSQQQYYHGEGVASYPKFERVVENPDLPPPLMEDGSEQAEEPAYQASTRAYTSSSDPPRSDTPPISPSRVGAVWNQFFDNVGRAGEAQQPGYSSLSRTVRDTQRANAGPSAVPYHTVASIFGAVRKNELQQLQNILLQGVSPNQRDVAEKGTPLHLACELGDVEAVMLLSEFAADLEARDETGNTPLLVGCYQGNFACVKFLLQSAVNLSAVNENGDSALHLAAWDGSLACVSILLEYGIEPSMTNHFGLTALGNMKTRSPLRHKFDDLPQDHPIRQTISVLEELEQQESQETGDHTEIPHDAPTDRSTEARASDTDSNTSKKSSWAQWIFGFRGSQAEDVDTGDPTDEGPQDSDSSSDNKSGGEDDSEDPEDLASYEESRLDPALSGQPYERLTPPPEVEEALRRAKAVDSSGERPPPAPTHPMDVQAPPKRAVLSPTRGLAAGAKKPHPSSPASNVRARYVDTFNSSPV